MAFQDILKQISEETDRTALATMAEKYPSLRAYAELGEKVAPLQERVTKGGVFSSLENTVNYAEAQHEWHENDWNRWQNQHNATLEALAEAQAKITELEGRTETEMTPEEIREIVTKTLADSGVVTNKQLEDRFVKALTPAASEKEKSGEIYEIVNRSHNMLANTFQDIYTKLTPKILAHSKEFDGEILDPKAVFDHMQKTGQQDPIKAYDDLYAPKRTERMAAQHQAEVEKARTEGKLEGKREAAQSTSGRASIVDGKATSRGPLMRRWAQKVEKLTAEGKAGDAPLGSGLISQKAAEEYRNKQIETNVQ